jgi:MoaA/NifB/PqqE/SkfB family radical SAM enzyme
VKYFDARASEGDAVEITGGEPTLVEWLEDFIKYLHSRRIRAVMRTNGFRLFKNVYDNLVVVFNPHDESDEYIETKKALLSKQDIMIRPKIVDNQKPVFENDDVSPHQRHGFEQMRFITADGNVRTMSCTEGSIGNIFDMSDDKNCIACRQCPFMLGAWNLIQRLPEFSLNV